MGRSREGGRTEGAHLQSSPAEPGGQEGRRASRRGGGAEVKRMAAVKTAREGQRGWEGYFHRSIDPQIHSQPGDRPTLGVGEQEL